MSFYFDHLQGFPVSTFNLENQSNWCLKMSIVYFQIFHTYNFCISRKIVDQVAFDCTYFLFTQMKEYMRSYMKEAEWRNEGYTPTTEEHMSISLISCAYKFLLIASLAGMGDIITDESFKWASTYPPLVKASCKLCRFQDDIVSHKVHPTFLLVVQPIN